MSKMTDEMIAAMTPEQSARYEAVRTRGMSLAGQMGEALDQQLARAKVARNPKMSRGDVDITLSGRKPTTHDAQTPAEIKDQPTVVGPGIGGGFSSTPKVRQRTAPSVVAPRTPDQAPRVTFAAEPNLKRPDEPRPIYRAATSVSATEVEKRNHTPEQIASFDRQRQHDGSPSMAAQMRAAMTPAQRQHHDAIRQKVAADLQRRSNRVEDELRRVHAVKRSL